MARKKYKTRRRVTKKNYRADTYRNRQKNSGEINRLQQRILNFLYLAEAPRKLKEIERAVATSKTGGKEFASALETLVRSGDIIKNNRRAYTISTAASLFEARLEMNHRGFGFAEELSKRDESQLIRQEKGRKAPYISPNNLGSARHDDRILVRIFKTRKDDRAEAEVIGILKRSSDQLVGIYNVGRGFGEVLPEDPRFPFVLKLRTPPPTAIPDGSAVLVSVQSTNEAHPIPTAEIIKILGKPEHIDVQAQCVINSKRLKEKFSRTALSEAKEAKDLFISQREDLRDILHITIDGADARDFDDAIGILKTRNGFTLFVSIADVSAYVIPGTTLDREAFERGTSVYFPHKVLPMLPEILSNDRCSLVPEQDRPTLTVIMEFSRSGELLKKRFTRGLIRSAHRFTYDTVKHIVIDKAPLTRRKHKPFLTPLKWAYELATILQLRRTQQGSLSLAVAEAKLLLNESGTIESIVPAERNFAHQIIEEFMLAANQAAAQFLLENNQTPMLRIHEPPDQEKIKEFSEFAKSLGLSIPTPPFDQRWINKLLAQVESTEYEFVVNSLLLRSMQQARYSIEEEGHFGLAIEHYTHFTSPIRRYPDLIVHRQIINLLNSHKKGGAPAKELAPAKSLAQSGEHLSNAERKAVEAERELLERMKVLYLAEKIGEPYNGTISGVNDNGFFVELDDLFISGLVPIASLKDDYYLLDSKRHRLIGDISGRLFRVGQRVKIIVEEVDTLRKRITLTLDPTDTDDARDR